MNTDYLIKNGWGKAWGIEIYTKRVGDGLYTINKNGDSWLLMKSDLKLGGNSWIEELKTFEEAVAYFEMIN